MGRYYVVREPHCSYWKKRDGGGIARFLQFPPFIWLGEAFYYLIAWNRRWLGKVFR
ncbi:MAG TPA: hypothetical protein VNK96_06180 [Fimbriimonadales bacterium]|nr:hypothetical protein [Fimbriimonadales bacterium]